VLKSPVRIACGKKARVRDWEELDRYHCPEAKRRSFGETDYRVWELLPARPSEYPKMF